MPDAAKRSAHLRTCRSRNSPCLAVAAKEYPSANSNMARARLASPTGVFCFRSHPVKVARVWSSIPIWIAEWRPCISPPSQCRAGVMKHPPPHCQFFCPFSMGTCTKRHRPLYGVSSMLLKGAVRRRQVSKTQCLAERCHGDAQEACIVLRGTSPLTYLARDVSQSMRNSFPHGGVALR